MSKLQRIWTFITAILTICCAIGMSLYPDSGVQFVILFLTFSLTVSGFYSLGYYFTMARYMVDGQLVLIRGIFLLNLGLLMLTISNRPLQYVMIYLLLCHAFSGFVAILRALERRKMQVRDWKYSFFRGVINISLSIVCVAFINSANTMVYIYSLSLISSAITRIANASKQTAMVYIS